MFFDKRYKRVVSYSTVSALIRSTLVTNKLSRFVDESYQRASSTVGAAASDLQELNLVESGVQVPLKRCFNIKKRTSRIDLKIQIRVGRNGPSSSSGTVSIIRWDSELGFLAKAHLHDSFVPTFDHLANANNELEGLATAHAAVENLLRSAECASVMHGEFIALLWEGLSITWWFITSWWSIIS